MPLSPQSVDTDWLNRNATRNYPLADWATGVDDNNRLLPQSLVLDISLTAASDMIYSDESGANSRLYVSSVSINSQEVQIYIKSSLTDTVIAYGAVSPGDFLGEDRVATMLPLKYNGDYVGSALISMSSLDIADFGSYVFSTPGQSEILPTLISMRAACVSGMVFESDTGDQSDVLRGDVVLRAGGNTRFVVDGNTVTVSAIDDAYIRGVSTARTPIRSINGVGPDQDGNLQITPGSEGIGLNLKTNGIEITSEKATPCGGWTEQQKIKSDLSIIAQKVADLQSMGVRLNITVDKAFLLLSGMGTTAVKTGD